MDEQGGRFRHKRTNFSMVSNEIIRDNNITLKAKGLYALIQSYITIEGFTLYKSFLQDQCKEGKRAFESAWNELKDAGYLVQCRRKDLQNHFFYEYDLLDTPVPPPGTTFCGTGECTTYKTCAPQNVGDISIPKTVILKQNNTISNHITTAEEIREQIGYEAFPDSDKEQIDEMILLVVEVLNKGDDAKMRIARTEVTAGQVKERFKMLNQFHIQYTLEALKKNVSAVKNIKSYLLTTLYNAPATYNSYYQQQVQFDLERKHSTYY